MAGQASLVFHRGLIKSEFWRKTSGKVMLAANIISAKLSCCHENRQGCNCSPCTNLHVDWGSSAFEFNNATQAIWAKWFCDGRDRATYDIKLKPLWWQKSWLSWENASKSSCRWLQLKSLHQKATTHSHLILLCFCPKNVGVNWKIRNCEDTKPKQALYLGNMGFRIHHQNQGTNVIPALNREVAGRQHPFGIGRPHAEAVRGLLPSAFFANLDESLARHWT